MPRTKSKEKKSDLLRSVKQALKAHRMITGGDRVLIGVSGGPDSMALLYALKQLAAEYELRLGIAHLNHRLRGAAGARDAAMVLETAKNLGLPCHIRSASVMKVKKKLKLSLEDAGRRVRYAFFNKVMLSAGYDKLAVGHQMDDNAEQMLLALVRGTGPRGLSGIAPVRGDRVIRPLIETSREEIETYLAEKGIQTAKDASNDDPRFLRNRIRKTLLPLLVHEYNPRIAVHLNRLADITRTEETWIADIVEKSYEEVKTGSHDGAGVLLSVGILRSKPLALKRRLLRKALEELTGDLKRITFSHVEAVVELVTADKGEKRCHLPWDIRVVRSGDRLVLRKIQNHPRLRNKQAKTKDRLPVKTTLPCPLPRSILIREWGIGFKFTDHRPDSLPRWRTVPVSRCFLDYNRISFPLALRPIEPGDRFTPLGAPGKQKIKKYLIDHKVPRRIRATTPLLVDRRGIVWLVGQRMEDYFKISRETTRVLGIEFFLLDI